MDVKWFFLEASMATEFVSFNEFLHVKTEYGTVTIDWSTQSSTSLFHVRDFYNSVR